MIGSGATKLMGQGVESLGSLMFKKLSGEAEHIGKAISKQAPDFTKAIAKEVDQYPPARVDFENLYRNGEWDEIQRRGKELMDNGKVKEAQEEMGGIVNMNNPNPAAQSEIPDITPSNPLKREITGLEGKEFKDAKKGLRQDFANWLDSEPNLIDPPQHDQKRKKELEKTKIKKIEF